MVNNAGVMAVKNYTTSKDGIESQFATCDVGHYLLTNLLIKEIHAVGDGATIVNVASLGYLLAEANLEDPNFEVGVMTFFDGCWLPCKANEDTDTKSTQNGKTYGPWQAYGQAKTANMLFAMALGKRLRNKGVAVFAIQPGGE